MGGLARAEFAARSHPACRHRQGTSDGKRRKIENAPLLEWKILLTYSVVGEPPATLLMTSKTANLENIPADRALKLNVKGAGNYRVEYDAPSWNLLLEALPKLGVEDRVNLLS